MNLVKIDRLKRQTPQAVFNFSANGIAAQKLLCRSFCMVALFSQDRPHLVKT
jgi:hypothetical protein